MAPLSLRGLVLLLCVFVASKTECLRRQKREWVLPPTKLSENVDYTKREYVAKIRSDKSLDSMVEYSLLGRGANKDPFNLFIVNQENGFVRITGLLDRENIQQFNLTGVARYPNGTLAETDISLRILVTDQNDNPPSFKFQSGSVFERSPVGTPVMRVKAEDADEDGTINAKIAYNIIKQEPAGNLSMFSIDRDTGIISVKEPTLDQETHNFYQLIIEGVDMDGAPDGNTGTGTVEIDVLDINDNLPTLEKDEYTGSIDEGVVDVEVMRIKVLDKDLKDTDNWLGVFDIVKGNEDGLFAFEMDKATNEGILKLVKPVDFEKNKEVDLDLAVSNVAPFINEDELPLDLDLDLDLDMDLDLDLDLDMGPGVAAGVGAGAGAGVGAGAGAGVDADLDLDLDLDTDLDTDIGLDVDVGAGAGAGVGLSKPGPKPAIKPKKRKPKPRRKPKLKPKLKPKQATEPGTKPDAKPAAPGGKSYPVKINVNNLPDGPGFKPTVKELPVSENPEELIVPMVIGSFPAVDGDTGQIADNVRYAKGHDPDNWLTIDEETSEIKLIKVPDRESKFLVDGTYYAMVVCMTKDVPSRTATGTIALKVTDSNDHCPKLTSTYESICSNVEMVNMTAVDEDVHPNGAPYSFTLIEEETRGEWQLESINSTTVGVRPKTALWPGIYELTVEIKDMQGLGCEDKQKLQLEVCTCGEAGICSSRSRQYGSSINMGAEVIGLALLSLASLLFVPFLLMLCQCGGVGEFADLPFDAKEYLIPYHTEGMGEDKKVPHFSAPVIATDVEPAIQAVNVATKCSMRPPSQALNLFYGDTAGALLHDMNEDLVDMDHMSAYQGTMLPAEQHGGALYSASFRQEENDIYEFMALPDAFLHEYFSQKSSCAAANVCAKESLLVYDYEGQGSPVGSVGCCSLLETDNDLEFLNDLGPRFATLAEICNPPKPCTCQQNFAFSVPTANNYSMTERAATTNLVGPVRSAPPSPKPSMVSRVKKTVSGSATLPRRKTRKMLQPQQPMYYMVEEQFPETVLLAERPPVGLAQGMYVVNGAPRAEGVLLQSNISPLATLGRKQQMMYLIDGDPVNAAVSSSSPPTKTLLIQGSSILGQQRFVSRVPRAEGVGIGGQGRHSNGTVKKGERLVVLERVTNVGEEEEEEEEELCEADVGLVHANAVSAAPNLIMVQDQVGYNEVSPAKVMIGALPRERAAPRCCACRHGDVFLV